MHRHAHITLLPLIVIAALSLPCFAQEHIPGRFSIGGHAGVTFSKANFQPSVPQTMIAGAMAGFTARYSEERHFGVIAEFNIQQRGWKEKFEGYDYRFSKRFTYIQIPLLTHIFFGNDKYHIFFNAGPEIGFLIANSTSSNFDYGNVGSIEGFPSENRNTAQYALSIKNRLDYGISGGLGLELMKGSKNSFTLEGRFYYGLNDVFSNHKTDPFSASSGMSIMINLGYNYRLK